MNAKLLTFSFLPLCLQATSLVVQRVFALLVGAFAVWMAVSTVCAVTAYAEEYDIIIEKNLFHDQRQKWEMEKSLAKKGSSQAGPAARQEIDQIKLFGTVIKGSHSYAVMRLSKSPQQRKTGRRGRRAPKNNESASENKRPYAIGDFVGGYLIVSIEPESVLLQDPNDDSRYEIFLNDGQTERTVERTELAEEIPAKPPREVAKDRRSKSNVKDKATASRDAARDALRQRFERDLQSLQEEKNEAVSQRAERDWEKLQSMVPRNDENGREDLEQLKNEFERLRQ